MTIIAPPTRTQPKGVIGADIMIVGECPTRDDVKKQGVFVGSYGDFWKRVLADAGIHMNECHLTYACHYPAKAGFVPNHLDKKGKKIHASDEYLAGVEELKEEIRRAKPKKIIALGNLGLYSLTGQYGITKWRGSQLRYTDGDFSCDLLPTYSPAVVVRQYSWRNILTHDLRRAASDWVWPEYNFIIAPTFTQVMECFDFFEEELAKGLFRFSVDLETRVGHIACCGLGWSARDAICIPFMKKHNPNGYWQPREELHIIRRLRQILTHPNAEMEYQNGSYDIQYEFRWWKIFHLPQFDTMLAHHVAWAGTQKSLDYLSSMYCRFHAYWKDDGKLFDLEHHDETQLWEYNCKDCVVTYEVATVLRQLIPRLELQDQLNFQMKRNLRMTSRMMIRGVRRDDEAQQNLYWELEEARQERMQFVEQLVGRPINPKSPKQISDLMYEELGQRICIDRKTKRPTTNDEALTTIGKRTPILRPICDAILDCRSIGVLTSTFVNMATDSDGRLRCSYNVAGTETYRYSSSENAFGSGGNLQNIPNPEKTKGELRFRAPNVKTMFIPDEGKEIADFDLDRADLQVVVWEAGAERLKELLRLGVDLHLANAQVLFNLPYTVADLLDPTTFERIKKKYKAERDFAKAFTHGTNYGAGAPTMASTTGTTVMEAERSQKVWFSTHPELKDWHRRVEYELQTTRQVVNKFGFRRYYFDRIEGILPEALAWVPQSTVAIVIDKGMCNVDENLPDVDCLLQVHDSAVFQYPIDGKERHLNNIRKEMEIVVPYDDPLIIPVGAKVSEVSWGHCEDYKFRDERAA